MSHAKRLSKVGESDHHGKGTKGDEQEYRQADGRPLEDQCEKHRSDDSAKPQHGHHQDHKTQESSPIGVIGLDKTNDPEGPSHRNVSNNCRLFRTRTMGDEMSQTWPCGVVDTVQMDPASGIVLEDADPPLTLKGGRYGSQKSRAES